MSKIVNEVRIKNPVIVKSGSFWSTAHFGCTF